MAIWNGTRADARTPLATERAWAAFDRSQANGLGPPNATPRARGAVATPHAIAIRMAERALAGAGSATVEVLDAGCGDGRLLVAVARAAAARAIRVACTGVEIDPALAARVQSLEAPLRVAAGDTLARWRILQADFLAAPPGEGVDIAIANPPYVTWRDMNSATRAHLQREVGVDLAAAFVERLLDRLRPGGTLVAIVPNKLLVARYAARLRQRLRDTCRLEEVWDLSCDRVFGRHAAYPVVLVVRCASPEPDHATRILDGRGVVRHHWARAVWDAMPDAVLPLAMDPVLAAIAARLLAGPRFATVAPFACGIATSGFGRATGRGRERLLRARDVAAFHVGPGSRFDPAAARVTPATLDRLRCRKIVVPGMFRRLCAGFDGEGTLLGRVYWTPATDDATDALVQAFLNSRLVALLYAALFAGAAQSGGWLRANAPYLEALPWPSAVTKQQSAAIRACVRRWGHGDRVQERARLDRLVEQAYGLTDRERGALDRLARSLPTPDTVAHGSAA